MRRATRSATTRSCRSAMGTSTSSWSPTTRSTATARAPNTSSNGVTQQDVDLARRITEIAAAVAAGGTVVDDSTRPSLTVIADQDGNKGIVCVDVSAAKEVDADSGDPRSRPEVDPLGTSRHSDVTDSRTSARPKPQSCSPSRMSTTPSAASNASSRAPCAA